MDVRVEDLTFDWRGRRVLSIDALHFPAGRTTAVLGPNGAGKTTLLRLICGLARPSSGRVLVGGNPAADGPRGSAAVAFSFQQPVFVRGTVAENLELGLRLRGVAAGERRERIEEVARDIEVTHLLARPAHGLSLGEAQRVNLARALALCAPVTLLDEPLASLDAAIRARVVEALPALLAARRTTAIVVTHDRDDALRLADRVVVLSEGRVSASGEAREVLGSLPGAP